MIVPPYIYIHNIYIYIYTYTTSLDVFPNNHHHPSFPIFHLAHSTFNSFQLNETTTVYLYPTRKRKNKQKTKNMNPIDDLRSRDIPYTQPLNTFLFFLFLFVVFPPFSPGSPRCNVSCSVGPCQWPGDEGPNRTGPWGGWAFHMETPSTLAKREIFGTKTS